jgi:hypothetical protein
MIGGMRPSEDMGLMAFVDGIGLTSAASKERAAGVRTRRDRRIAGAAGAASTLQARNRAWYACVAVGWLALGCGHVIGPAQAQAPERPALTVAAALTTGAPSRIAFPIEVGPASSIPRGSFVRVRGLPPLVSLSEGHVIAAGTWAVPLAALPNLSVIVPVTPAGESDVRITLIRSDGVVLGETSTTLTILPPATGRPAAATRPAAAPPPSATAYMQPNDGERALEFMAKGNAHLADGRIAPARLFFERAAEMGLAQAAMALARTYDASELVRPELRNVMPDAAAARRWYERARALGAREAEQRLRRLESD